MRARRSWIWATSSLRSVGTNAHRLAIPPSPTECAPARQIVREKALPFFHTMGMTSRDLLHIAASTATSEGRLVDERGKLLAHGSETCMIFPAEASWECVPRECPCQNLRPDNHYPSMTSGECR